MPLTKLSGLQIETPVDISAANLTGITTATDLNATRINVTGVGTISNGSITNLTGTAGTVTTLRSTTGNFTTGNIVTGVTTNFTSTNGSITNLTGTAATITTGNFTTGNIVTGVTTNFTSTRVVVSGIITASSGIQIGSATSTGTASQTLQVTGGAYVSGSVGIGTTNPGATLNVVPTATSIAGVFSGTTSSDMVRITQLGTGNALVVEDSANPDASPFVVKGDGSVGIGTTNPQASLEVVSNIAGGGIRVSAFGTNSPGLRLVNNDTGAFSQNLLALEFGNGLVGSVPGDYCIRNSAGGGILLGISTSLGVTSPNQANGYVRLTPSGEFLIGTASTITTGTASQTLQVTGGGYFSGRVAVGATLTVRQLNFSPGIQAVGTSDNSWIGAFRFSVGADSAPVLTLGKSAGASVGTYTPVPTGHVLGGIVFHGTNISNDSSNNSYSAAITAVSTALFTASSTPSNLLFATTPVGAISPSTRMTIHSNGNTSIGVNTASSYKLQLRQFGSVGALFITGNESVPGGDQIMYVGSNTALNYGQLWGISDANNFTWQSSFKEATGPAGEHRFYSWTTLNGRYNTSGNWFKGDNTTTWSTTSDIRIKKNIKTLENGLNIITSLRPVEFDYKRNNKHEIGFIAQEYEQVLPEQVINDRAIEEDRQYIEETVTEQLTDINGDPLFDDNGDPVTTSYKKIKVINQNLVPYLISAVKEQQAIIESLTARIQSLEYKTL